jgi:hypothetical protein
MKILKERGYVVSSRGFQGLQYYRLTRAGTVLHLQSNNIPSCCNECVLSGRELCYALFNDKFHPNVNPMYVLVRPRCNITRDGSITAAAVAIANTAVPATQPNNQHVAERPIERGAREREPEPR